MLTALLFAACATSPYFVRTVTFKDSTRVERFQYGMRYYMKVVDVHNPIAFTVGEYPQHPEYCAWVVRDEKTSLVHVGYNDSPQCQQLKPEQAALHEACHLRMAHTSAPFDNGLTPNQKEAEVAVCMKAFSGRILE